MNEYNYFVLFTMFYKQYEKVKKFAVYNTIGTFFEFSLIELPRKQKQALAN